jgi:nitrogenase molybdenum-cofactor synthesis protein NifE
MKQPEYYTVDYLANHEIPEIFDTGANLIYSSPATLAFNSPGAQGFGVKRAGLSIPDSVMLIVSPGCCGRNTSAITVNEVYKNRYFYYLMDETDIITGRHLPKIKEAVKEIVAFLDKKPSVVMICITCVDALLGTDMERVAKECEDYAQVKVRPCYMYALTREGRRPPMVHVRESLYSLLEPLPKDPHTVNLLGFFAPLHDDCELYDYLKKMGITTINELSRMESFEDFLEMARANFNLILYPEARAVAKDLRERLNIGDIELTRFYTIDFIHSQYQAFAHALGVNLDDTKAYEALKKRIAEASYHGSCAIGETCNLDPIEAALALSLYGFDVKEIYCTLNDTQKRYLKMLKKISPETRVYCNNEPTMLYYDSGKEGLDFTIGKDAAYYHKDVPNIPFNEDVQPFGYQGVSLLLDRIEEVLS